MESKLEERRLTLSRAQRNLIALTKTFGDITVHEKYLSRYDLTTAQLAEGFTAASEILAKLYTSMIADPKTYAMKGADDDKGLIKNTNFLYFLAKTGELKHNALEISGSALAQALKETKVTKPESYLNIFESLGFNFTGMDKKIESSGTITTTCNLSRYLLPALKAMVDAIDEFEQMTYNRGSHYFEMLDCRVLSCYPAVEPQLTMPYILSKLDEETREITSRLDNFLAPNAKRAIKGGIGWYWTVTYTSKKTKKVIASLKLDIQSHDVKLNLANIGKYTEQVSLLPKTMIAQITSNGWDCGKCNPKCDGAFEFILADSSYSKCRCGSFVFAKPTADDTSYFLELLKSELDIISA